MAEEAKGQAITYRVEELTKVAGYTSEVKQTKDGNIIITNTHVPETKEVSGQKTWEDNENQDGKRPTTITVNLLADGQPIQHKEVSEKMIGTIVSQICQNTKTGKKSSIL